MLSVVLVVVAAFCLPSQAAAKVMRGWQGVELGMDRASVLKALEANRQDMIDIRGKKGFSTLIPRDKLFRHADFIFDDSGCCRRCV